MTTWVLFLVLITGQGTVMNMELHYDNEADCNAALTEIAGVFDHPFDQKPKYSRCLPMKGLLTEREKDID